MAQVAEPQIGVGVALCAGGNRYGSLMIMLLRVTMWLPSANRPS